MFFKHHHYLQIAFNRSFAEVKQMVAVLPSSDRIILEAGVPFIKRYGGRGIKALFHWWSQKLQKPGYIVADLKCMDRGLTEAQIASQGGASGATCLGLAPIETLNQFIEACKEEGIDSIIDMLNVEFPFEVLGNLEQLPDIVMVHRGVDEGNNFDKEVPFDQIQTIKNVYDVKIALAGGESFKEAGQAIFNDADIAVVWRAFYENPQETANLAEKFLREIR